MRLRHPNTLKLRPRRLSLPLKSEISPLVKSTLPSASTSITIEPIHSQIVHFSKISIRAWQIHNTEERKACHRLRTRHVYCVSRQLSIRLHRTFWVNRLRWPDVWTTGWERLDSCKSRHGSDEEDHIGSHIQSYVKAAGEMGPRVKEAHNEEFEEYLRVERK